MLKIANESIERAEEIHPGFREMVDRYEALELPPCPGCDSADTARVSSGIVSRSIHLAAASSRFKLVPGIPEGRYWCNACECYFDAEE